MTKNEFEKVTYQLLSQNQKNLIFLRIPNSAGNRHYFFIENKNDFDDLLNNCDPSDSLSVFKSFNELSSGLVTKEFIDNSLKLISSLGPFT
jgi:hypothetical protein